MASYGVEYQFIGELHDNLKCSICSTVVKGQPMQHGSTGCGKLFCKKCIERNGNKPCPICKGRTPEYFKDARSLNEIKALRVRCGNKLCEWTGTVATFEDHVTNTCKYTLINCTNNCQTRFGKNYVLLRKDLDDHLKTECPNRSYKCPYCGKKGIYTNIMGQHDQQCLRKPVPCLNRDCPLTIEKGRVQDHVARECEHTIVSCKYSNIGCTEKRKRKDMKIHEDDDRLHLHLALNKIVQLSDPVEEERGGITVFINVPGFTEKKNNNTRFHSGPFYTVPNGYKMRIIVDCNGSNRGAGTHVSVYAQLLDISYKEELEWPFKGTVRVQLQNQLQDIGHESYFWKYIDNEAARIGDGWGFRQFIEHSKLSRDTATNTCFLLNDTLCFKITVEEKK